MEHSINNSISSYMGFGDENLRPTVPTPSARRKMPQVPTKRTSSRQSSYTEDNYKSYDTPTSHRGASLPPTPTKSTRSVFQCFFQFIIKKLFLTANFYPKFNPLSVIKELSTVCLPPPDDSYQNQIRIIGMQGIRGIIKLRELIQLIMAKLILTIITISEQVNYSKLI